MRVAELQSAATGRTVARPWIRILRGALGQKRTKLGLALVGMIAFLALAGPLLAPHTPTEFVGAPLDSPSAKALLGTDTLGRDVLSRVLRGGVSVLGLSSAATVLGVTFGVLIGLISGYSRRWLDSLIVASMDLVLAFPQIVLLLLFLSMLGPKLWLIVAIVAVSHTPAIVRLVRGITLELVRREFVEASEVVGIPRRRILIGEVLPNLTAPLMVEVGLRLTWSIAIIAAVSFLGFGIQPPAADWGLMINENRDVLVIQPWPVLVPVTLIALLTIGMNLLTEGVALSAAGLRARDDHA